jgi:hypothetical protein
MNRHSEKEEETDSLYYKLDHSYIGCGSVKWNDGLSGKQLGISFQN